MTKFVLFLVNFETFQSYSYFQGSKMPKMMHAAVEVGKFLEECEALIPKIQGFIQ